MKTIKTVCHRDCPDTCFIDAIVKDGIIISTKGSTENPVTQGFLCPRGMSDPKRVYSKKRVLYPQMRDSDNEFKRVSWDEALDKVTNKLNHVLQTHGNDAVLCYDYVGNQGFLAWQYPRRLWYELGATMTNYSLCSNSGHAGIALHYGLTYGVQPEDMVHQKVLIFWGNNAKVSSSHMWALALKARKNNGALIINIDPRESETSKSSDLWISPRPGSDVALAYGVAHFLIKNKGLDHDFLESYTVGHSEYIDEVLKWTPERIEEITGVEWSQIEELGEILINNRPVVFMVGFGLQKSEQGAEASRAVTLLPALLGVHRGFHYSNAYYRNVDWSHINGQKLSKEGSKVVNQVSIGPRLASGEYKFTYIFGSNPASTLPDQAHVRSGLARKDNFVVVHDTHWSDTTAFADVVLPAPTYMEKSDVNLSDHHLHVRLSRQVIDPLEESRDEIFIMHELKKRLGIDSGWLQEDPWVALGQTLKDSFDEGSFEGLLEGGVAKLKLRPMDQYQTPSGKIEFTSSKAIEEGHSPLPYQIPLTTAGSFTLLNSSLPKYTHSQFTDVYGPIPQIVWVNLSDAKKLEIKDDVTVRLYNELGEIYLKAVVTSKVQRGTLWAPRPTTGLKGNPLNVLVKSIPQNIGGGPIFNSTKVQISKHSGEN